MVNTITHVNREERRNPSQTHREKNTIIEREFISEMRPERTERIERPPLREKQNKFTITNYEYRKNANSSFDHKEENFKRSRNNSIQRKNSFSRNNSYLSEFNDSSNNFKKEFATANYENKFEYDEFKSERINNFENVEIKTEASQTIELVLLSNIGKTNR